MLSVIREIFSGRQKDESQNGCYKKTKQVRFSKKRTLLTPMICTRTCAYQEVRNVRFSENLTCFVFLKHPLCVSPFCPITDDILHHVLQGKYEKREKFLTTVREATYNNYFIVKCFLKSNVARVILLCINK